MRPRVALPLIFSLAIPSLTTAQDVAPLPASDTISVCSRTACLQRGNLVRVTWRPEPAAGMTPEASAGTSVIRRDSGWIVDRTESTLFLRRDRAAVAVPKP